MSFDGELEAGCREHSGSIAVRRRFHGVGGGQGATLAQVPLPPLPWRHTFVFLLLSSVSKSCSHSRKISPRAVGRVTRPPWIYALVYAMERYHGDLLRVFFFEAPCLARG